VNVGDLCYRGSDILYPERNKYLVLLVSRDTDDMGEYTLWQALFLKERIVYQVGQASLNLVSELP
jgi:hypothetical protein